MHMPFEKKTTSNLRVNNYSGEGEMVEDNLSNLHNK